MSDSTLDDAAEATLRQHEPQPLRLHLLRIVPALVVLGLLVHFLLPRLDSVADSLKTLRTMAPWAVLMAIFAPLVVKIFGAPGPYARDTGALDPGARRGGGFAESIRKGEVWRIRTSTC